MSPDERIPTYNLDFSSMLLYQTECPRGHAKGAHPCSALPDATPLYCIARMDAAGIRPTGRPWLHRHQGPLNPYPVGFYLPQGAHWPNCGAVFVPVPSEFEYPRRRAGDSK